MSIQYPGRDERRATFRRILEMLSQAHPATAAVAHLYGYTHPSQFEQDLERFQRDIAAAVNDHEERLTRLEAAFAPRAVISALALDVAVSILRTSQIGHVDLFTFETLSATFPDIDKRTLEEAVFELSHRGYARTTAAIGHPIRAVSPTGAMFLAFDLVATGHDTRADALVIAQLWLDDERMGSIFRLSEHLGWEPRRLNPPLKALRHVFPGGRWSQGMHLTFTTTSVVITSEERFKLRNIVESGRID